MIYPCLYGVVVSLASSNSLLLSSSSALDVSIVQYSVSAIIDDIVFTEERFRTFISVLFGGVRATSAYD